MSRHRLRSDPWDEEAEEEEEPADDDKGAKRTDDEQGPARVIVRWADGIRHWCESQPPRTR